MPHMAAMPTFEIGNPVIFFVTMKPDNGTFGRGLFNHRRKKLRQTQYHVDQRQRRASLSHGRQ
jgi:hypothetical protein